MSADTKSNPGSLARRDLIVVLTGVLSLAAGRASAAGRPIAVLEHRAAVSAGQTIATAMVERIGKLTAHRALSLDDARRRYGPGLHAAVAACKGEPRCIAVVGEKLGVEEVILVGLSQLGDLILAIQRIEVPSGRVLARLADSVSRRKQVSTASIDGYLRRLFPAEDFRRYGQIAIRAEKPGDTVFIDGIRHGVTPLPPIRLPAPRSYSVRVRRPGHADFVARLDVVPEATVEVTPSLTRRISGRKRWYERWWVWAIIGGVVAGGATTAAILARPAPENVDAVVRWPQR